MKIAVTAASGRLGRAILRRLLEEFPAGDIVAVVRDAGRVPFSSIEVRRGDYRDAAQMRAAFRDVDAVVFISSPVVAGVDRVRLHRNVIDAALAAAVQHLVCTSVIGDSARVRTTLFAEVHEENRRTEELVVRSGLNHTILRNGLYLELDCEHLIRANATGTGTGTGTGIYANPAGAGRCGYIGIDELAWPYPRLMLEREHYGQVYELTGPAVTQDELCALANTVFGLGIRYVACTDDDYLERFRRSMPQRGEVIARMLTGAFQCIRTGAFDLPGNYEIAAGRPVPSTRQMMERIRGARAAGTNVQTTAAE